ncbi:MAG: 16S rRNA (guanine(966)-N(2))-methyltransferase RsmD [Candidatus Gastranaerophilales bacterium]|nr:16S rRNA (guanine(966)-N(2))-methyltransferase RsmD [Candidatus Gastranaerophilales bacterium]
MIITGGSCKGRKINTVKSREVRPTSSKIRESIFNIIYSSITNSVMLDLFAGSGILGLEALSRGAKKVYFIENNPKVYRLLKENLINFDFDYEIKFSDALAALDNFQDTKFNIIFIDPPYASGLIEPVLKKIKNNMLLSKDGIAIIEHSSNLQITDMTLGLGLNIIKEKKYGDTSITIVN